VGDEISDEGKAARFARWEQLGLDLVKSDLLNGGHLVVGGPLAVRELAWEWVRSKEGERQPRDDSKLSAPSILFDSKTGKPIYPKSLLPPGYPVNWEAFEAARTRAMAMQSASEKPHYSRQTIIAAADMLKALGHTGFDRFLMELELPDPNVGRGSGLMARATSLADFAIKNPEFLSPERRSVAYEIILRAIEIWKGGALTNLAAGGREKFAAAMTREGLASRLADDEGAIVSAPLTELQDAPQLGETLQMPGFNPPRPVANRKSLDTRHPRRVFVVHGHDEAARLAVASFLKAIDFEVIILHEQTNKGRTVIEKFEAHSDVGFSVIILTPDDVGGKDHTGLQARARQNVILEWGYFIGRLKRARVFALRKGDVELPSDIVGIVWEVFDEHGAWKQKLAKELNDADYEIDWQKVARA
jgi:hypothetical protein